MAFKIIDDKSGIAEEINIVKRIEESIKRAEHEIKQAETETDQRRKITCYLNVEYNIARYHIFIGLIEGINREAYERIFDSFNTRAQKCLLAINNIYMIGERKNEDD